MKSILKTVLPILSLVCTSVIAQTTNFSITLKPGVGSTTQLVTDLVVIQGTNTYNLSNANLTCTSKTVGTALVYSVSVGTNDFDKNGTLDKLTFDLTVKAYAGSTYIFSDSAKSSTVSKLGNVSVPKITSNNWSVGTDGDVDPGETLNFTISNVKLTNVSANFITDSQVITSVYLEETNGGHTHKLIKGFGANLDSKTFNFPDDYVVTPTNDLTLTAGESLNNGTREWAISNSVLSIKVTDPAYVNFYDYSQYSTEASFYGEVQQQTREVKKTNFCWDKVPLWAAIRSDDRMLNGVVKRAAENYQMLLLEKANAQGIKTGSGNNMLGIEDLSTRLKAINPDVTTLFYLNSVIYFGGNELNAPFLKPDWYKYTLDANGNRVYYMVRDVLFTINPNLLEVRNWWIDIMLTMANKSTIDGVFVDKVGDGDFAFDGVSDNGYGTMLHDLYQQMPANKMVIGNSLRNERNNGNRQTWPVFDGSYLERWEVSNKDFDQTDVEAKQVSIQLCQEALSKGKIINFRAAVNTSDLQNDLNFKLGFFLIFAEENAYFGYIDSVDPDKDPNSWDFSHLPEFNYYLGPPKGPATRNGYVYKRSYENVDVTVDLSTEKGTLVWKDKTILPNPIATLSSGNVWYHNYRSNEYKAPVSQTAVGTLDLAQASPSTCKNPSSKASKFTKASGTNSYIKFTLPANLTDISKSIFKLRVYTPANVTSTNNNLRMFLRNNGATATQISVSNDITVFDQWVEYTFDFSAVTMKATSYNELYLFFAQPDTDFDATGNVYYFDAFQGPSLSVVTALQETESNSSTENVTIYPNPFTNIVSIDLKENTASKVEVYNAMGQLIKWIE